MDNYNTNIYNTNSEQGTRFRNKYNRKIGRIVSKSLNNNNYSIIYDDGSFEISLPKEDMDILPEINQNTLSVEQQEIFMHLLYDVVHNAISPSSLEWKLDYLNKDFDLLVLLNTKMKNEKYSNDYILPMIKVLYEDRNHIYKESDESFYGRKMKVLRILANNGAKVNVSLSQLEDMKRLNLIDDSIIYFINRLY